MSTNLYSSTMGSDPSMNQFGLGSGSSSALTGDASKIPFVGGLFPDPRQAEFQKQMQAMANAYARQRLINQKQREQAFQQQLALFQPTQNQLAGMYGPQAAPYSSLNPDSLFGGEK
jgi:hypothetical protein